MSFLAQKTGNPGSHLGQDENVFLTKIANLRVLLYCYYIYFQDAFPGVVVANHMININPAAETFINMCKPFMRKELLSKVNVLFN